MACARICDEFSSSRHTNRVNFVPGEELKIPRPAEQEVELVNVGLAFRDARESSALGLLRRNQMSRYDFEATPARDNFSYNTRLGDEADHSELATASVTKERVDFA